MNSLPPGVEFSATATVTGNATAESRDAAPAEVTLDLAANVGIDMSAADIARFLFADLGDSVSANLAAFDGTTDFDGPSAIPETALGAAASDMASATDLLLFTGTGVLRFNAFADGQSSGTGAGNLATIFNTNAGVELAVTYTFNENVPPPGQVPVPAPLALLGLGLAALGIKRARKA